MISPLIQPYAPLPGTYSIPCNQISGIEADISFSFTDINGNTFNLTVPTAELSVGPFANETNLCQTSINALDFEGIFLIGGSLLKHYYSVWDIHNQQMGFGKLPVFCE